MRGIYLAGYVIFMIGVFLGLWQLGIIERIGETWTMILVILAVGAGLMGMAMRSRSVHHVDRVEHHH